MAPNPKQPLATRSVADFVNSRLHRLASVLNHKTARLGGLGKGLLLLGFLVGACNYCAFLVLHTPNISLSTGQIVKAKGIPKDTLRSTAPISAQEYKRIQSYSLLLDSVMQAATNTSERRELERKYQCISDSIARLEHMYHLQLKNR